MSGVLEVLNPGLGNGIQDAGRFGYRHMGITVSGCLDRPLARCANALAGNAADAACIEVRVMGAGVEGGTGAGVPGRRGEHGAEGAPGGRAAGGSAGLAQRHA